MPKFIYQVPLTDGTIARRTSHRVYTHLIEISPRTIESFVYEMNEKASYYQKMIEEYRKTDFRAEIDRSVSEWIERMDGRGLSDTVYNEMLANHIGSAEAWYSTDNYAQLIESVEKKIAEYEQMRDVAIADGHPTIGNYFASNWCGSHDLAVKKMNSADVRYWTERGAPLESFPPHPPNKEKTMYQCQHPECPNPATSQSKWRNLCREHKYLEDLRHLNEHLPNNPKKSPDKWSRTTPNRPALWEDPMTQEREREEREKQAKALAEAKEVLRKFLTDEEVNEVSVRSSHPPVVGIPLSILVGLLVRQEELIEELRNEIDGLR